MSLYSRAITGRFLTALVVFTFGWAGSAAADVPHTVQIDGLRADATWKYLYVDNIAVHANCSPGCQPWRVIAGTMPAGQECPPQLFPGPAPNFREVWRSAWTTDSAVSGARKFTLDAQQGRGRRFCLYHDELVPNASEGAKLIVLASHPVEAEKVVSPFERVPVSKGLPRLTYKEAVGAARRHITRRYGRVAWTRRCRRSSRLRYRCAVSLTKRGKRYRGTLTVTERNRVARVTGSLRVR